MFFPENRVNLHTKLVINTRKPYQGIQNVYGLGGRFVRFLTYFHLKRTFLHKFCLNFVKNSYFLTILAHFLLEKHSKQSISKRYDPYQRKLCKRNKSGKAFGGRKQPFPQLCKKCENCRFTWFGESSRHQKNDQIYLKWGKFCIVVSKK